MKIKDFTYTFLPTLVEAYLRKELPFSALVDFDFWKELFPPEANQTCDEVQWYQIKLVAKSLEDQSLILIYSLPEPMVAKMPKFVAIRIDRENIDSYNNLTESKKNLNNCPIRYYALVRPSYRDDPWDIQQFDMSKTKKFNYDKMEWVSKNNGTWSLRAFLDNIEKIPMYKENTFHIGNDLSFKGVIKDLFGIPND